MSLSFSQNVILNIMKQTPDLGKTKLMKIIYMIQQVKKINLGYDFGIYTYGPYSTEVLESVDELVDRDFVSSEMYRYSSYVGYKLNLTDDGGQALSDLGKKEAASINDIIEFSSGKTAKDLELYSTIIYVCNLYLQNKLEGGEDVIIEKVREIKPHFDKRTISEAYEALCERNYIKS